MTTIKPANLCCNLPVLAQQRQRIAYYPGLAHQYGFARKISCRRESVVTRLPPATATTDSYCAYNGSRKRLIEDAAISVFKLMPPHISVFY
ncbi:MAG: hypothetical protein Q8Q81_03650 [Oxalobacteraceae bacterium]|nr:hypothetical protein [Oxalobacteraceae bacterium]